MCGAGSASSGVTPEIYERLRQFHSLSTDPEFLREQAERSLRANETFRQEREEERRNRVAQWYLDGKQQDLEGKQRKRRRVLLCVCLAGWLVYAVLGIISSSFFEVVR